jgi:hypothetical protein
LSIGQASVGRDLSLVVTTDPYERHEDTFRDRLPALFDRWWKAYQKDATGTTLRKIQGQIPDDLYGELDVAGVPAELMPGNALEPAARLRVRRASKATATLERLRERLRRQVARDLDIEGPPRKERQQLP